MQITLFTPTYNRAYLLERLFLCLQKQNFDSFEWIIVDDGSTDDTEELVKGFIKAGVTFPLKYIKQENQGKHIAINRGVKEATGELFFIVDSDDYLADDALIFISKEWDKISDNELYGGVVPNKCIIGGTSIGNPQYDQLDCSTIDFRYKRHEKGDKAEVIRTSLFRKYPFPETKGEKFCPEALFFNRLKEYKLRYFNKDVYFCEYLPDGLSARIFKIRKDSPVNACLCYSELSECDIPIKERLKACINFYRFYRYTDKKIMTPGGGWLLNTLAKLLSNVLYILSDRKK